MMKDLIITTVLYRWRIDLFLDDERTLERRGRNRSYKEYFELSLLV